MTEIDAVLKSGTDVLTSWTINTTAPENGRLDIYISRTDLLSSVNALKSIHWGYLAAITGLDHAETPKANEEVKPAAEANQSTSETAQAPESSWLEVLYHFCSGAAVLTLRVKLSYASPSVPSICGILPAAGLYERELSEMFGIEVIGAPHTGHLMLPDDWPNGVYPLRKEFVGFNPPTSGEKND